MSKAVATGAHAEARCFPSSRPSATRPCQQPHRRLHVGVFFDGTDNNKDRDLPQGKHTNVVRLWRVYRELSTAEALHKKFYVDGVGSLDTAERRRQAGRQARQNTRWYNPVAPALRSAGSLAADLGRNVAGMAGGYGGEERLNRAYFWLRDRCGEVPEPATRTVDVYGFSRGAALARTFVNLVNLGLRRSQPHLRVRLVGVFDTVGSFGLAGTEYDPGQSMYVDGTDAQRIVHYTARHEHRHNFPLTIIPGVDAEYPGVHSDVGGSYAPRDEDGRVNHLAYIPLTDMYRVSARMGIPMSPLAGEIAGGVDVEALRRQANTYAGADPRASPNREFAAARDRFFQTYVHESAVLRSRWWYAAGPIGAAIVHLNPNKPDSSGARRKFTPRRKRLVALPPNFSWR